MDLPDQLVDAISSALKRRYSPLMPQNVQVLQLSIDESFHSDGFAGSDIRHLNATIMDHGTRRAASLFTKRWSPSPWVIELTRLAVWLEILFYENGTFDHINSIPGVRVPVIGSARTENGEWIIMDDVSAELTAWKEATAGPKGSFYQTSQASFELYTDLLDRIAQVHAKWETSERKDDLSTIQKHLARQERRLRSFESLFREWFGSADDDYLNSQAMTEVVAPSVAPSDQWTSKRSFAAARRQNYQAFLDRLSNGDRLVWIRHMQSSDALVEAASALPQTLLHGDLGWRNIGLCRAVSGNEFILIDWEFAMLGSHALDVIGLISGPAFSADEHSSLEEHYLDMYIEHGGQLLNKQQWKRACQVAIALDGICRLPHNSEIVRRQNQATYTANIESRIERTQRVMHDLSPLSQS